MGNKFGHCLPYTAILANICVLPQQVWPLPSVHRDFWYYLCTSATSLATAFRTRLAAARCKNVIFGNFLVIIFGNFEIELVIIFGNF